MKQILRKLDGNASKTFKAKFIKLALIIIVGENQVLTHNMNMHFELPIGNIVILLLFNNIFVGI